MVIGDRWDNCPKKLLKDIMGCIEIRQPVAVVTCSLDCRIHLWDLLTGAKLGSLNPRHTSGVRCLDYAAEFGDTIISTGHEVYSH